MPLAYKDIAPHVAGDGCAACAPAPSRRRFLATAAAGALAPALPALA